MVNVQHFVRVAAEWLSANPEYNWFWTLGRSLQVGKYLVPLDNKLYNMDC